MLKLKNGGFIEDRRIIAVIMEHGNHVALMDFGHRIVLNPEEYAELIGEEPQKA